MYSRQIILLFEAGVAYFHRIILLLEVELELLQTALHPA
jgi:hypothetical protein